MNGPYRKKSPGLLTVLALSLSVTLLIGAPMTAAADLKNLEEAYGQVVPKLKACSKSNFNWDWLTPLNNLERCYLQEGNYQAAEPLARERLRILTLTFGQDGNSASAMTNLAEILLKLNKLDEAEQLFKTALSINKQESHVYGQPAPNFGCQHVSRQLTGLGHICLKRGKAQDAELFFRENYDLAVKEEQERPRAIYTPQACLELGKCLQETGKTGEAMALYEKVVQLPVNAHSQTAKAAVLRNYADLLKKTGKAGQAGRLLEEAKKLEESHKAMNRSQLDY